MKNDGILYWLWLSERCGIASRSFRKLVERYENPFDLYRLEVEEIEQLEGISRRLKNRLADKNLDFSYGTRYECEKNGIWILPFGDPRYPERLKKIEDPPVLLYGLGELPDLDGALCIGMVGTRNMSVYGRQSAYKISYELAAAGSVIVSGMALGVDGVSAAGALAAGGKTVAVLGSGLLSVYPKEHKKLMGAIVKQGAVLSEYPPTMKPYPSNFPKRNRIVSGMCQGLLVVEGTLRSGSMITANLAQAQGKDVFALPGKINESNSDGPNDLIRGGATAVLSSEDILKQYDFLYYDRLNHDRWEEALRNSYPERAALLEYGVPTEVYLRERMSRKAPFRGTWNAAPERFAETEEPRRTEIERPAETEEPRRTEREIPAAQTAPSMSREEDARLDGLDPLCRKIFEAMPIDRPASLDELVPKDVSVGDVMMALTLLEVSGFCVSLPGSMFMRK